MPLRGRRCQLQGGRCGGGCCVVFFCGIKADERRVTGEEQVQHSGRAPKKKRNSGRSGLACPFLRLNFSSFFICTGSW